MIRKYLSMAALLLLLAGLAGCTVDLGVGMIRELGDYQEGILQELGELRDGFLEEMGEWSESFAARSVTDGRDPPERDGE